MGSGAPSAASLSPVGVPCCRSACQTAHSPADDCLWCPYARMGSMTAVYAALTCCRFLSQSVDVGVIVGVAIDAIGDG